ncbi:serine/threonine protein kinase [Bryobacter aggregatus]|uniref:serine/threonine protein kinase n=1 Tax=Bryobacter aggregatus TaxID=360054 RepID=UPI00069214F8|nr:serine/threonine-protein kinase [Bryobacter aggregatus]
MEERFQRIQALFHAALDLPSSRRQAFLLEQTGADDALIAEINALLAADENHPPEQSASAASPLQRYGIYQTISILGRGGMGSVYLAERSDGQYNQKVAVKVLAHHLGGEDFEARFRVERQLLAQMNHPNIVRLLDGGITASGEPYLVTEFVAGISLDRYCDERKLSITDRVKLFLQVCSAVDHAHQNLIVHRDLKPSNILVTEEGVAKLLDFGTAKLLKGPNEQTVTEVMLLTPRYASPEQLRKDAITTRSDVYSLGMILYELLGGQRPFGDTGEVVQELARAYQYSEAAPLGKTTNAEDAAKRGSSLGDLRRQLAGDLRVVTAKALEHDPLRRYASPRELGDDLQAWLDSRPVKAQPATIWYRSRKFLYRQRFAVAATLLIVAAGASGVVSTLREKALAERRFNDVRKLAHYQLFDLYDETLDVDGTTKLRAGMSDRALQYLDSLAADAASDESLAVEVALGFLRVGDVTGNYAMQSMGRWQEALAAYRRGLQLVEKYNSFAARRARLLLQTSITNTELSVDRRPEHAQKILAQVKEYEDLAAQEPKNIENHLRLGKAYQNAARAVQQPSGVGGFTDLSEDWTRKAKAAYEKGLEIDPDSQALLRALYQLSNERAGWIAQTKPQEALRWASDGELWRMRMPAAARRSPVVRREEAAALSSRATAASSLGESTQALADMDGAIAIFESLVQADPDNLAAQMDLIVVSNNRGLLCYDLGRKQDYAKAYERSLELADRLYAIRPIPRAAEFRIKCFYNLSYAYSELKDPRADAMLEKTVAILKKRAAEMPDDLLSRVEYADLVLNLKHPGYDNPADALPYVEQITKIAPGELNGWELLAAAQFQLLNYEGAIASLEKSLTTIAAPKAGEEPSRIYKGLLERLEKVRATAAKAAKN